MGTFAGIRFSVLDLAPTRKGGGVEEAFRNTLELAQFTEGLGFHRFWLAEHHNIEGIASAATAVLIGYVAGGTSRIRVGSGGIMLPNHSPLVIAEQFGTLATLYPDRIDLGLGRAPGSDGLTMRALRRDINARETEMSELVQELLYYFAPPQPGQRVKAIPGAGLDVPIWLLGSSLYSAQLAAALGRPFSFAAHFAPEQMMEAIEIYRRNFKPSEALQSPQVMVGVQVIAANTDEQAEFLATTSYQRFLGIIRNQRMHLLPPVHDMDSIWSPAEKAVVKDKLKTSVIGGPIRVKEGLQKLIQQTGADELIIMSDAFDFQDRKRSFEIIGTI